MKYIFTIFLLATQFPSHAADVKINSLALLSSTITSLANSLEKITPAPLIQPKKPLKPASSKKQTIVRRDFFKDVVGMDEKTFRERYSWHGKPLRHSIFAQKNEINDFRRAAIFHGAFKMYTVQEVDENAQKPVKWPIRPYLKILLHDPCNPKYTDIRYLQANPDLKYANFQIASTLFGPLEGGMYPPQAYLTSMLKSPVQGEEASISAAPATIYRKYFMKPRYLLYYLKNKFPMKLKQGKPYVDVGNLVSYHYETNDINKVGIGIHRNIVVTSGYGTGRSGPNERPGPDDKQERLSVEIVNGGVDEQDTQIIHQIFNSAYNLKSAYDRFGDNLPPKVIQAAKMILRGMYKGTLRAPWITNNPVIVLTLLGAGAFLNDLDWIADAIESQASFIRNNGLQIILIYRPDPRKTTRSYATDLAFLQRMYKVADVINNSDLASDGKFNRYLQEYVQAAYSGDSHSLAKPTNAVNKLNLKINTSLPTFAPHIPLHLASCKDKPIDVSAGSAISSHPLHFNLIKILSNQDRIGWLTVPGSGASGANDAVLINLKQNMQPQIDGESSNFMYINPDVPSVPLPAGLFFWKSQGLELNDIGNHKKNTPVRHWPGGKDFVYDRKKRKYVDSHKSTKE